jgi:hypothetical protein
MTESRLKELGKTHWLYWHNDGREWFIKKECFRNEWRATVEYSSNYARLSVPSDYATPGTPEGKTELIEKLGARAKHLVWFFDQKKYLQSMGGDRLKKHVAKWEGGASE